MGKEDEKASSLFNTVLLNNDDPYLKQIHVIWPEFFSGVHNISALSRILLQSFMAAETQSQLLSPGRLTKPLTVKILNSGGAERGRKCGPNSPSDLVSSINSSIESSPYDSPSIIISPSASPFSSALQSPYISPRVVSNLSPGVEHYYVMEHPSPPVSHCGSQYSDEGFSSSYTPPPEPFDFPENSTDKSLKFATCIPYTEPLPPRISFSFPMPRVSFTKGSASPSSNTKLRSCDVYIGFHGQNSNLLRFCKWLKSEMERQGIACFVADRARYSDAQSHDIANRVIRLAAFGVVVITDSSLFNHLSIEEIKFFAQKKNLVPLWFGTDPTKILNSNDKEWQEPIDGLVKSNEFKLEANESNWRSCVSRSSKILTAKLGRNTDAEREVQGMDELPFRRNKFFIGREKEMMEIETTFFGTGDLIEEDISKLRAQRGLEGISKGTADKENGTVVSSGDRCVSFETMNSIKDTSTSVSWTESCSLKRLKDKETMNRNRKHSDSVVCITGISGVGKTELALEFAYRYRQRYKKVLWVGGEARYFRQNILNLSINLGFDVSADVEKERGRIRSFQEQESESFQRVKKELFRDMPYLIIIDNLEMEKEWCEGRDLHDLIPRNTGASHVIITTRLSNIMSLDPVQLSPLSLSDAMVMLKGKRKDYSSEELEFLRKFDERLGRSSFGLSVVGSLLSELDISPPELFEALNQVPIDDLNSLTSSLTAGEEQFYNSNPFLMRIMSFCSLVLERKRGGRGNHLASSMLLAGAWFAPASISVKLLAVAAKKIPAVKQRFGLWRKCTRLSSYCCSTCYSPQIRKTEVDSALSLVKLGLAKRTNQRPGYWIQFHPITLIFAKAKGGLPSAKAMVQSVRQMGNPILNFEHLWASAFHVFGFKDESPLVQLKSSDMVIFIQSTALPLAIQAFTTFSQCNSAVELLTVCTNLLEEVEKSFSSQLQNSDDGSLCWKKKKLECKERVDEYVWQDVMLLKATLLETRAKLLLRGGNFDSGEELCRTCISIRTVMLGHNHAQTLAAQETLAKLVRLRSKM